MDIQKLLMNLQEIENDMENFDPESQTYKFLFGRKAAIMILLAVKGYVIEDVK